MPNDLSNTAVAARPQVVSLVPRTMEEAIKFSTTLSKSDLVPKDFVDKPANILVAIQWGFELGLQPMQAMQSIAVINGRPSLWGDAVIALVRASPECEYIKETIAPDGQSATCKTKRKGEDEQERTFTMDDAAKAGLKGKQGPWSNYPKRMLQMRARSWCLRDVYPDILRGVHVAEEVQDIEKDVTPETEIGMPQPKAEAAAPAKPAVVDVEVVKEEPKTDAPPAAKAEAKQEAQAGEEKRGASGTDFETKASAGHIGMIRKKAENAAITEAEICKEFKLESLDGISVGTGNMILQFLSDPAGYSSSKK